ncbi:hypothetical protein [Actinopolymorpha alba]|uniref:hypothetical protein n=1 Tax=Actinopolymorpha alba TaxID=533267 RepID=UPI0003759F0B|nr:hypothetical protein [Actinopolymorpha alba]
MNSPVEAAESPVDKAESPVDMPANAGAGYPPAARDPGEAPLSRRARGYLVAALLVVLVAAVVASVFLAVEVTRASAEERLRGEALRTARQLVLNFTTVDYRAFDRSRSGVLALSSGDFREQYSRAMKDLENLVKQNETVSRGKILDAGIVSFDGDSAQVLVAADADVTNVAAKTPALRTYRLQLDLARDSRGWRVVELQFVG